MKLSLRLYLPKNADEQVVIDKSIEFYILALDGEQSARLQDMLTEDSSVSPNEIEDLGKRIEAAGMPKDVKTKALSYVSHQ